MKRIVTVAAVGLWLVSCDRSLRPQPATFDNSLFIAPHYVGYLTDSDERFAHQAAELKRRFGSAPHVLIGFAVGLWLEFPDSDLSQPLTPEQMAATLQAIDRIVERAHAQGLRVHITLTSGFFHGANSLRTAAILQDVRNAQWFADGWIGNPSDFTSSSGAPSGAWITPSRAARLLRSRMEEGVRIVGSRLAMRMKEHPDTLMTISGDGEVELNYERSVPQGEQVTAGTAMFADYSPFMIEEFRDWIERTRYTGDRSPSTDDNRDGRTFNRDFKTSFTSWKLRYYESSGPIPYSRYLAMKDKLPSSGPYFLEGGFDAPRAPEPGDPFWELWTQFRTQAVANYVRDFATWMTTSPATLAGFNVPAARFYSHQIPADFLFQQKDSLRLKSSASPLETAFTSPVGSAGVTVFNTFNGWWHKKTGTPELFERLSQSGANWGIFEYNPSMPVGSARESGPSSDISYYLAELRSLYRYRPHVIVPFAWSDVPHHKHMNIQNSTFESALIRFIGEVGNTPWVSRLNAKP
jgi:hypothetical protein